MPVTLHAGQIISAGQRPAARFWNPTPGSARERHRVGLRRDVPVSPRQTAVQILNMASWPDLRVDHLACDAGVPAGNPALAVPRLSHQVSSIAHAVVATTLLIRYGSRLRTGSTLPGAALYDASARSTANPTNHS
jgi:hypothetical protein